MTLALFSRSPPHGLYCKDEAYLHSICKTSSGQSGIATSLGEPEGDGGHIVFCADPVGVGIACCLRSISLGGF